MKKFLSFQKHIWEFYSKNKRDLPWRKTRDPYHIVVSEVMLQQTQVPRVLKKYQEFLHAFPSFTILAQSSLSHVLSVWQGMGYNRRAKYLQEIARIVIDKYQGTLPQDPKILETFPGIGWATARSIVTFAFNTPVPFIETNIRRVFIHHFFTNRDQIADKEILPLVEKTIDIHNPRDWYYALMDYGTMLGKQKENPNIKSKHYTKQSTFSGSDRQIRGEIIRVLLKHQTLPIEKVTKLFQESSERVVSLLGDLEKEGLVVRDGEGKYRIG